VVTFITRKHHFLLKTSNPRQAAHANFGCQSYASLCLHVVHTQHIPQQIQKTPHVNNMYFVECRLLP